jgi:hypothetical protein
MKSLNYNYPAGFRLLITIAFFVSRFELSTNT